MSKGSRRRRAQQNTRRIKEGQKLAPNDPVMVATKVRPAGQVYVQAGIEPVTERLVYGPQRAEGGQYMPLMEWLARQGKELPDDAGNRWDVYEVPDDIGNRFAPGQAASPFRPAQEEPEVNGNVMPPYVDEDEEPDLPPEDIGNRLAPGEYSPYFRR